MSLALAVSRRGGQRCKRPGPDAVMQLNPTLDEPRVRTMTAPEAWRRGFFEFSDADLFKKCQDDLKTFRESKSTGKLIDLIFALGHLPEWILACARTGAAASSDRLESAQSFVDSVVGTPEWKAVHAMCNRAKHFHKPRRGTNPPAVVMEGLRCGLGRFGEPLDRRHFAVGVGDKWVNVEDIVQGLIDLFQQWFDCQK